MGSDNCVSQRGNTPAHLGRTMTAVGAVLFALYLATLSPGVFPGVSAGYVSAAVGLQPWASAAHPLWRLFVFLWCRVPGCGGAWWLNLSSALWGAVAAALFCRYVARWVYATIWLGREKKSGPVEERDVSCALTEEEEEEERRVARVAVVSGAFAAGLLGTGLAFWSASTRLQPETFGLMLVWVSFALYQDYLLLRGSWRLYALALLGGLGVAETTMFWAAAPFLVGAVVAYLYRHHRLRFRLCLGLVLTGLLGLSLYGVSAHLFSQAAAGAESVDWQAALRELMKLQLKEVAQYAPASGWPLVLLLLVVPWLGFQMGYWRRLHLQRDFRADALLCACLAVTVLLHFNAPLPPWVQWRLAGRLPVLEAALAAMLGGWTCAYWMYGVLFRWEPAKLISGKEVRDLGKQVRVKRLLSVGACSLLLTLAVLAALRSGLSASGRRGLFADRCAQEILDQLGERTWLLTDGVLDTHLAVLAAARGRTLRVLNLAAERDAGQVRRLRRWVAEEPRLQADRGRLLNAASLGAGTFVREWVAADPEAEKSLALYVVPAFWSAAGLSPRPDRFLFLGARSQEVFRDLPLVEEQRAFWGRMRRLLPAVEEVRDPADVTRLLLRCHLSLVANDLGVLLMDLGRDEEAFDAFREALLLEPKNLSAVGNQTLLVRKGVRPSEKLSVEAAFRKAMSAIKRQPLTFDVVRRYGQIRSPEALAGVGAVWAQLGQYGFAQEGMRRAADLAEEGRTRDAYLASFGRASMRAGEFDESERAFRGLLEKDSGNLSALLGLLNLAVQRGDEAGARGWLAQARGAGAKDVTLLLAEAQIDVIARDYAAARTRLLNLTDKEPRNLVAWALLAAASLHLKQLDEVERQIVPKMQMIVNKQPNALVYQVCGDLARAKGPASYGAARDAYRSALQLNPGRPDLLTAVLDLDLLMKDDAGAARDAADLLRADSDNGSAHFVLGTQALARGDLEAAEPHFRKCLATHATAEMLNNLANLLLQRGRPEDAELYARRAVAQRADSAPLLDTLAEVLLARGETAEAAGLLERARSLEPANWQIAFTAARALMRAGRKEEARALLKQVQNHLGELPPSARAEVARVAEEWKSRR